MSKKCQIPSWKMGVSVNFESPYPKKFVKNLKKEAHRHLELTVLNTFSEKKNYEKKLFLVKSHLRKWPILTTSPLNKLVLNAQINFIDKNLLETQKKIF